MGKKRAEQYTKEDVITLVGKSVDVVIGTLPSPPGETEWKQDCDNSAGNVLYSIQISKNG